MAVQVRNVNQFWKSADACAAVTRTHRKFRDCAAFLVVGMMDAQPFLFIFSFCFLNFLFATVAVASKLASAGYQQHLDDLLLRLDFNNFYQSAPSSTQRKPTITKKA